MWASLSKVTQQCEKCKQSIYLFIYIYIYIYTYIHTHTYIYRCVYIYICVCLHIYVFIYVHIFSSMQACWQEEKYRHDTHARTLTDTTQS
jgi:hypothetical protein